MFIVESAPEGRFSSLFNFYLNSLGGQMALNSSNLSSEARFSFGIGIGNGFAPYGTPWGGAFGNSFGYGYRGFGYNPYPYGSVFRSGYYLPYYTPSYEYYQPSFRYERNSLIDDYDEYYYDDYEYEECSECD